MRTGARASLRLLAIVLTLATSAAGCGGDSEPPERDGGPAPAGSFDAERAFADLEAQVALGPRPAGSAANRRQTRLLARRLRAAGARDVLIQRPHRNVVGSIPGSEPGYVVVGAHHDTKDGIAGFVGANDGASGVAVVLELARSLPRSLEGPSIALALFDAEEARGERSFERDGIRGSRQYVRYAEAGGLQGTPPIEEIRAMVLFDLVGDCDLQIPREEGSDPGLYELFAKAAAEVDSSTRLAAPEDGPKAPFTGTTGPILDDHVPFARAGIPAVDLIDLSFGPGDPPGAYWHTAEDTLERVCVESLDAVGTAALRALPRIR